MVDVRLSTQWTAVSNPQSSVKYSLKLYRSSSSSTFEKNVLKSSIRILRKAIQTFCMC